MGLIIKQRTDIDIIKSSLNLVKQTGSAIYFVIDKKSEILIRFSTSQEQFKLIKFVKDIQEASTQFDKFDEIKSILYKHKCVRIVLCNSRYNSKEASLVLYEKNPTII